MALRNNPDLILPKGSLILITGASGYVGSNIVYEALEAGYRVRGTTRSAKTKVPDILKCPNYELAVVPMLEGDGAFDEAIKGVNAVIHMATPTDWSTDPKIVVEPAIKAVTSIMTSALKEPSVKRFVYASSSVAATLAKPGQKLKVDKDTWNTEVEEYATKEGNPYFIYSASKVKSELALWNFVKEHRPHFVANSIVPNFNIGRVIGEGTWSNKTMIEVYDGKTDFMSTFPPQHMVNVVDDARLHLIAAIDGTVANERIFAFAYPFNWNDILDIFRELRPGRKFLENDPSLGRDIMEIDNALGAELLKKWYDQESYIGLKDSIMQHLEGVP